MNKRISTELARSSTIGSYIDGLNNCQDFFKSIGINEYKVAYTLAHFDYDTVFWHIKCSDNQLTMLALTGKYTLYSSL
jgi:hypothetical protein